MTVDYMSRIQSVAESCRPRRLMTRVLERWLNFEKFCSEIVNYDVFELDREGRDLLRELVSLLYETGIGDESADVEQIRIKNRAYGGSWCKRGGTGAFHMLARKADRMIEQMRKHDGDLTRALADVDGGEMLEDTIGDLRRYLILVEAWHAAQESSVCDACPLPSGHEGDHA